MTWESVLTFLRDSAWEFIFGFLALLEGAAIYLVTRQVKEVAYYPMASTRLFHTKYGWDRHVEVYFDGKPVADLYIIVWRVKNTGTVPITASDYITPITVVFHDNARILSVDVLPFRPEDLLFQPQWLEDASEYALPMFVLNPDDSITLQIVVDDPEGEYKVTGRIVGIRALTKKFTFDILPGGVKARHYVAALAAGLAFAATLVTDSLSGRTLPRPIFYAVGLVALILFGLLGFKIQLAYYRLLKWQAKWRGKRNA